MYCRVIACDFDGTGAIDGHPAPELYAALAAARAEGIVTLLVTGRVLEDVQRACEEFLPFDAVVAENGAVVHLCGLGRTIQIGSPPPDRFLGEQRSKSTGL
jgi:hydroxymethylpyrimidine pyrophosphatase-like HAD family hydrolase